MNNPPPRPVHWWDEAVAIYEKDVDVTLLRENLKLTVEERLKKFIRTRELYEELRRAGEEMRKKKNQGGK